jgi:hypothetical protein
LFTPTAAVFVEVGKSKTLRDSKLAADATAYKKLSKIIKHMPKTIADIFTLF